MFSDILYKIILIVYVWFRMTIPNKKDIIVLILLNNFMDINNFTSILRHLIKDNNGEIWNR